jgi:hypothetical protein
VRTSPNWTLQFGALRPCRQALIAGDGSGQDKNPSRQMKELVWERVDHQPGNGVHREPTYVANYVMPLKDLVKHDAVNEAPRPRLYRQTRRREAEPGRAGSSQREGYERSK